MSPHEEALIMGHRQQEDAESTMQLEALESAEGLSPLCTPSSSMHRKVYSSWSVCSLDGLADPLHCWNEVARLDPCYFHPQTSQQEQNRRSRHIHVDAAPRRRSRSSSRGRSRERTSPRVSVTDTIDPCFLHPKAMNHEWMGGYSDMQQPARPMGKVHLNSFQ